MSGAAPQHRSAWRGCSLRLLLATATVLSLFLVLAHGAFGAIVLRAASSANNAAGSSALAISKPTGVVQGDVMVAAITVNGSGTITAPSGWTAIQNTTQGTVLRQAVYYKVAGASEGTSYSWSLGSTRSAAGGIVAYSGVNQTVPIDASATGTSTSGNAVAPSVTTSAANDLVIAMASFATTTTVTPASGTSERFDETSALGTTTGEAADFSQATAGATGTKTITPLSSTAAWIAATVALRDASQAGLSVSTTATPTFSTSLNSGDTTPTYTVPLTINDSRTGETAGLGWNATITSTQLLSGSRTLPTSASTVTAVTSSCLNGGICTNPTNSITYPLTVPAGSTPPPAVKFYNAAAATGKGTFTTTPTVTVAVPQNSFAGTYTSTLTISIVSGP